MRIYVSFSFALHPFLYCPLHLFLSLSLYLARFRRRSLHRSFSSLFSLLLLFVCSRFPLSPHLHRNLISCYPLEWEYFSSRMKAKGLVSWNWSAQRLCEEFLQNSVRPNSELADRIRLWASYRAQTVVRTIRGILGFHSALLSRSPAPFVLLFFFFVCALGCSVSLSPAL